MATAPATTDVSGEGSVILSVWSLSNAENGDPVNPVRNPDRTVQVSGTFGSATVTIQGSNDKTNWNTLTDSQGADLAYTAASMDVITEAPLWIRPSVSGGGGTTDVKVSMLSTLSNDLK